MCLFPELIRNPRYKKTKKNGGIIPPYLDGRVLHVPIGCGDCMECRAQKAREWQIRLLEDIRHNTGGKFICLTFSNENVSKLAQEANQVTKKTPRKTITLCNGKKRTYYKNEILERSQGIQGYTLDNAIATLAMRKFNERWRKQYKQAIRHWTITELGHNGTENIHLHGIVWTKQSYQDIRHTWQYGYIWPRPYEENKAYVAERTVNYVIKYVHKMDRDHIGYKPIILCSPGIGGQYTKTIEAERNKFDEANTTDTYKTNSGHEIAMPAYWRNKIYTDQEREALWLHKLDKEERYVCKEKIDISQGDKEYFKLLHWYRRLNKELGYGEGKPDWNRKQYEEERRKMLHGQRGIQTEYGKNKYIEWQQKEIKPHEHWKEEEHWTELNYWINQYKKTGG